MWVLALCSELLPLSPSTHAHTHTHNLTHNLKENQNKQQNKQSSQQRHAPSLSHPCLPSRESCTSESPAGPHWPPSGGNSRRRRGGGRAWRYPCAPPRRGRSSSASWPGWFPLKPLKAEVANVDSTCALPEVATNCGVGGPFSEKCVCGLEFGLVTCDRQGDKMGGVGAPFPLCTSQEQRSGCQTWWQALSPMETSISPKLFIYLFVYLCLYIWHWGSAVSCGSQATPSTTWTL